MRKPAALVSNRPQNGACPGEVIDDCSGALRAGAALCGLVPVLLLAAGRPADIRFEKQTLDVGANETCAFADINGDGRLDIVSGENWYAAPKWMKAKFRQLPFTNGYIDAFSDLPVDVDGDGHMDIVTATWFSREISWWRNPGKGTGEWKKAQVDSGFNTEFAFLVDLDNDGKPNELLPQYGGQKAVTAWYELRSGKWVKHVVAERGLGHGIGAGDVNGDKRNDILTPQGWFEAPPDPRSGSWTWHADWTFKEALGFLYVEDVNGDGKPDLITSSAHDYGLFWVEQTAPGKWEKRMIDDTWSQVHAVTLVDLNGDGKRDILTGKRYMAHDHDPGAKEPLGVYWYERTTTVNPGTGKPTLARVKHILDYSTRTGGGMQLPVADIDGDGDLDIAAPGKSGLFLFLNRTK
jgi:hypothetical protein